MEATQLIERIAKTPEKKTNLEAILEAYQKLDYHRLNDALNEECLYQDMSKTSFLWLQKRIFEKLKKKGDTEMLLSTSICEGCLCNAPVFVFTGNQSGLKYAMYFEFTNNVITDIFRCFNQSHPSIFLTG